jgi:hypothetical protein
MNNTGMAKVVHGMYLEPVPPQVDDSRIRTCVDGFPIAMFYKEKKEQTTPEYFGIYNFNNDKSDTNTYGYYEGSATESWEFCNNDSQLTNFNSCDFESLDISGNPAWMSDFEARFPEDYTDPTNLKRVVKWVYDFPFFNEMEDEEEKQQQIKKFRKEFEDYWNLHYVLVYYILTEVFAMIDSRAKNMFITTWDTKIWYPVFYDMDK